MACEVPGNASRGSEKRSAAPGGFPVAEAKVQATSSLPLHGMAGFKGCRPDAADPRTGGGRYRGRLMIRVQAQQVPTFFLNKKQKSNVPEVR